MRVRFSGRGTFVRITILLLCALSASMGCQPTPAPPAASTSSTPPTAASPSSAPAAGAKAVPLELPAIVARVNGQAISKPDFERAIKNLEKRNGGPVPADQRNQILRSVLDQMIGYRLLAQEAANRKIAVTDAEIDGAVSQVRGQYPNEQAFNAAVAEQGMTAEIVRDQARTDLLVTKVLQAEVEPKLTVQDAEIGDYYAKNPDKFAGDEAVHASHILIRVPEKADAAAKTKARARAQGVLAKVKRGADFGKLATELSEDPISGARAGDVGFFTHGQMVPAFEAAAFAMQPGTISDIVESPFGFHIIKVIEKRPPRALPLEEVKGKIKEFLLQQQREQKTAVFIDQLNTKGKVEILI
jgi:peptidyl-prolyl cis-trans isomerase C